MNLRSNVKYGEHISPYCVGGSLATDGEMMFVDFSIEFNDEVSEDGASNIAELLNGKEEYKIMEGGFIKKRSLLACGRGFSGIKLKELNAPLINGLPVQLCEKRLYNMGDKSNARSIEIDLYAFPTRAWWWGCPDKFTKVIGDGLFGPITEQPKIDSWDLCFSDSDIPGFTDCKVGKVRIDIPHGYEYVDCQAGLGGRIRLQPCEDADEAVASRPSKFFQALALTSAV